MDHIVVALDGDIYTEPGQFIPVPFLVFELCDKGDIARHAKMARLGLPGVSAFFTARPLD